MSIEKSKSVKRHIEITDNYFSFLDKHIEDVVEGKVIDFMELSTIASELYISHSHLSDTIRQTMGHHPCHFYDLKIIEKAKFLLLNTDFSISDISKKLTYDPSNFSKFFKKFTGFTPGVFRQQNAK